MMRLLRDLRRALVLALCITACKAEGETRPTPKRAAPPKAHEPEVTPAPEAEPAPAPVAEAEPAPIAEAAPKAEPAPKAEQDLVETETWPFERWDHAKLLKAYDRTSPKWEAFFGKTLGLDLAPAKAPKG